MRLPFAAVVTLCYVVLVKWMFPCKDIKFEASSHVISDELKTGKLSIQERRVLSIFGVTISLWILEP